MCKNCEKLEKTSNQDQYEIPEIKKLMWEIEKAVFDYQEVLLHQVLKTYETQTDLFKTEEQETFFDLIANLLESVYLYGQWVWLKYVKAETKELEAIAALDFNLSFDINPIFAKDYAQVQTWALIKNIDDHTQAEVQKIVTASINQWRTQSKLAQVINDSFTQYNKVRSELIAQQETALALWWWKYNQFVESSKAYNTPWYKIAYTQQDSLVRDDHSLNADAWRIPANEPFPWTWDMHEPFGFRCRCACWYRMFLPS